MITSGKLCCMHVYLLEIPNYKSIVGRNVFNLSHGGIKLEFLIVYLFVDTFPKFSQIRYIVNG